MSDNFHQDKQPIKERLKEETRLSIVRSGIKAFSELGFHGMKIAAVTRDAGVANGTFYLHFKDKEALYNEIVKSATAKLASQIFAAHNYSQTPGGADRAVIAAVLEFAEQNRDLMRIAMDTSAPNNEENTDLFRPLIELRISELERGIKEGHINANIHPEVGARAEIGMLLSVIQWWLNNRGKAHKEQLIDTLTQLRRSWAVADSNIDDIDTLLSEWDSRL